MRKEYEGKRFYKINKDGSLTESENIYYLVYESLIARVRTWLRHGSFYKYIEVIDGSPVQAFLKNEIVVIKDGKQVA